MRNKIIVPALAAAVIGIGALGAGQIFAQTPAEGDRSIIQKLSQKLGIGEDKIKLAFDEIHSERHAEKQAETIKKLDQAVSEGKITEAQKQAILSKMEEFKNNRPDKSGDFKNMTPDQRTQKRDQLKKDMESWAAENGLSLDTLHQIIGFKSGERIKHMRGF